jgi:O-antigen/teichoic acid export membrane protein
MSMTGRVMRNALLQAGSQVITWVFAWALLIFLPRYLGDDGFGRLFFAISFAMIASIFLNLGVNTFLMREVSREPESGPNLLANAMSMKLTMASIVYVAMMVVVRNLGMSAEAVKATDIIGFAFLVGSFGLTFSSYLLAEQQGKGPAMAIVYEKFVVTAGSVAMLVSGHGLVAVAWMHLAGSVVSTTYLGFTLYRRTPFRLSVERDVMRRLLMGSAPFLIWIVFGEIYVRIDVLMLSSMTGDDVVGWYGAAFRLYGTMLFVPNIFMSTVFPAIARKFASPGEAANVATRRSFNLMLLVAVPIGLGMTLVARPIVDLLFGLEQFGHSVANLRIFGLCMVFVCIDVVLGSVLIANDKQKQWSYAAISAAALNPLLNLVLIPLTSAKMGNGGYGAAIATLITEIYMMVVAIKLLPPGIFDEQAKLTAVKAALAGALMMGVVAPLEFLGLVPVLAVGAVIYLASVVMLRVLPEEDVAHLLHALRRRSA